MDSINGVLGILISTVKRGFVIFLLNLTSLEIDVMCTFFVGRYFLRHQIVPRQI